MTGYVVDDFGRTVQVESPVTGVTAMAYNPAGALETRTDAVGVTLTADYDAAGRLSTQEYARGGSTETVSFGYDAGGRRTRAEVSDGVDDLVVETFGHNRRGQVVTATVSVGLDSYPQAAYVYGHDGELEKVTYPSGRVVTYTPDFAGRPKTITSTPPGGGAAVTVLADATYLPAGPPSTLALGPGGSIAETLGHDWQYRRTTQTVGSWVNLDYSYDSVGNLTSVTDSLGNRDATYGYDDLSRLISADLDGAARAYTYDAIGNITQQTAGGVPVTYAYEQDPVSLENTPVLETITGPWGPPETVVTDAAGNITDDGSQTYSPDLRNHLGTREVSTATLVNTYTADGRLARTANAGEVHTQVLDPAGRRLALLRSGLGWRDYVYLGDRLLGYFDEADAAAKLVFTDHIGMPMLVVDGGGVVRWSSRAEPYGQFRDQVSKTFDPGLRYPGQWQDWLELEASCDGFGMCTLPTPVERSFSLFENGHRWYRDLGRYTQGDPAGIRGGINLFSYAGASPFRFADPLGLESICVECSEAEKKILLERMRQVSALQGAYLGLVPIPDPMPGTYPTGTTSCRAFGPADRSGTPETTYENLEAVGPCTDGCTQVHEQVHRDACVAGGAEYAMGDYQLDEAKGYLAEHDCLLEAVLSGKISIDVDRLGKDNRKAP